VLRRRAGVVERLDTAAVLATVTVHPLVTGEPDRGEPGGGPGGHVQLWPHRHGTDAMFICLLQKAGTGAE